MNSDKNEEIRVDVLVEKVRALGKDFTVDQFKAAAVEVLDHYGPAADSETDQCGVNAVQALCARVLDVNKDEITSACVELFDEKQRTLEEQDADHHALVLQEWIGMFDAKKQYQYVPQ